MSATLLASGLLTSCCFTPVTEPPPSSDGGDGGAQDAGPRIDGGPTGCTIGGTTYSDGDPDPLHPCQLCDASQSSSHWSYAPDRSTCGGGRYCFRGQCEHVCELDGGFVPPTTSADCRFCSEVGDWTPVPDGMPCMLPGGPATLPLFCFNGNCAPGCVISGTPMSFGTPNPENSCQYCGVISPGWTTLVPGTPCADGGTCDLNGNCGPAVCTVAPSGVAEQFPRGAANPIDPSLCCNPALDLYDWSPRLVLSQTVPTLREVRDFAVGDFNGDGWQDLALIDGSGPDTALTVLLNQAGELQPAFAFGVASGSTAIAAFDMNGDGLDDVVLGDTFGQTISVLTSHGDGTFSSSATYPAGPTTHGALQGADFNGDGVPDLIGGSGPVLYFQNLGDGGGLLPAVTLDYTAAEFAVGDLNGDHSPDVTLAGFGGSTGTVLSLLGNGSGGFNLSATWLNVDLTPSTLGTLAEGDLDGDGFRDLALTTIAGPGSVTGIGYLPGFGDGTFGSIKWSPTLSSPLSNVTGLAIGDLEGDGLKKVLFAVMVLDDSRSPWMLYEFNAVTGTTAPLLMAASVRWPLIADFNHDDAPDLIGAGEPSLSSPSLAIYLNGCPR